MHERSDRIPLDQCRDRRVYRVLSRNLSLGVFRASSRGFIGIRTKFGSRFLFEEYHWDTGAPYGTANPLEELGVTLPDDIGLEMDLGSEDEVTGRLVGFDKTIVEGEFLYPNGPAAMKGWYFLDTGEFSREIRAYSISNTALFDFLAGVGVKS